MILISFLSLEPLQSPLQSALFFLVILEHLVLQFTFHKLLSQWIYVFFDYSDSSFKVLFFFHFHGLRR